MNNLLSKVKNRVKGLHKSRFINPQTHWELLVKTFLIFALLLIIFSFYFLYKIKNEQIFNITPSSSDTPLNLVKENLLEKVNKSFEEKKLKSKEIKKKDILFLDPS